MVPGCDRKQGLTALWPLLMWPQLQQEKLFKKWASFVTWMKKSGKNVLNFWPWKYCCGWVHMVLCQGHRLPFKVSLVQLLELTFWGDMNISILFDKITVHFSLKNIDYSFKMSNSYSLSPLTPVLFSWLFHRLKLIGQLKVKERKYCIKYLQP